MKFSDGHWRIPENLSIQHPLHIHEVKIVGDEVIAEVAALEFKTRLDQINATVFTLRLSAPAEGVIGVRITHFEGERPPRPEFALNRQPGAARIEENDRSVTLHSGGLAATLPKSGPYCLDFLRNGKRITGSATKAGGHAVDRDTALPYMFERLDLTVGTNVYGLGERFTRLRQERPDHRDLERRRRHQTDKAYKNIPVLRDQSRMGPAGRSPRPGRVRDRHGKGLQGPVQRQGREPRISSSSTARRRKRC